jgi:hypothetical protein
MTLSRMLAAALVAAAVAAPTATARPALAGPAAADSHKQPDSWYAGKSTIEGSKHSGQQGANDMAKANVYVPPAAALNDTVVPANDSAKANVYVPPAAALNDTVVPANDSAKANVYVPPAAALNDTVAPANDSAKANVYVPPNVQPIQRHVPAASASSWGLDWGSAGIGSAVAIGAFLIALAGVAWLRRRRQIQPAATV